MSLKYVKESHRDPGDKDHNLTLSAFVAGVAGEEFSSHLVLATSTVSQRMAPLQTALADTTLRNQINKDEAEFQGQVDSNWRVISVPHGGVGCLRPDRREWSSEVFPGYLIGHVLRAATKFQSATPHKEPLYLASQFIGSSTVDPYTINLKRIKSGRTMSNLLADFRQNVGSLSAGAIIDRWDLLGQIQYSCSTSLRHFTRCTASVWPVPGDERFLDVLSSLTSNALVSIISTPISVPT